MQMYVIGHGIYEPMQAYVIGCGKYAGAIHTHQNMFIIFSSQY